MNEALDKKDELDVQLVCLKFLQTTDTLLQQADRLREQRDQFLKMLNAKDAATASKGSGEVAIQC